MPGFNPFILRENLYKCTSYILPHHVKITIYNTLLNASEDLRRTTSHETDGQAKLRKRSGIASEFLFISSHCSVVKIK